MRHPISTKFKNSQCRKALSCDGMGPRVKQVGTCARCKQLFAKSKLEVDHIEPAGALSSWEDVGPFVQRLLGCGSDKLRLLCKECHAVVTAAERFGCSENDAIVIKKVAAFGKLPASKQRSILQQEGVGVGRNAAERRSIYYQLCILKYNSNSSSTSTDG